MRKSDEDAETSQSSMTVDALGLTLVAFAGIVVATALYAVVRVVDVSDEAVAQLTAKSEVIRNIGLFLLGAIGLPLAIWRSWIAKQQVDEAIAQGRRTERQLQHAEKQLQSTETTALLGVIEKGGALLAETDENARRTGIHLLESVVKRNSETLSDAALEIIYQFARANGKKQASDHYFACMALFTYYSELAKRDESDYREMAHDWPTNLHLVKAVVGDLIICNADINFYKCKINDCIIVANDLLFDECNVEGSLILSVRETTSNTIFKDCDFSYSRVSIVGDNCTFDGCYYHEETPPTAECMALLAGKIDIRTGRSPHFEAPILIGDGKVTVDK